MKSRVMVFLLASLMVIGSLSGCGSISNGEAETSAQVTEDYLKEDMAAQMEDGLIAVQGEGESVDALTFDSEPGEDVFTSTTSITSLASARLLKEQRRSALLEIINSTSADEASIQEATNSMIALTDIEEKEFSAEILLDAKGFSEVVVIVTGSTAEVVVEMPELTDEQCVQIIDIVSRKTSVAEENIIITLLSED